MRTVVRSRGHRWSCRDPRGHRGRCQCRGRHGPQVLQVRRAHVRPPPVAGRGVGVGAARKYIDPPYFPPAPFYLRVLTRLHICGGVSAPKVGPGGICFACSALLFFRRSLYRGLRLASCPNPLGPPFFGEGGLAPPSPRRSAGFAPRPPGTGKTHGAPRPKQPPQFMKLTEFHERDDTRRYDTIESRVG